MTSLIFETVGFFLFLCGVRTLRSAPCQQAAVILVSCLFYLYKTSIADLTHLVALTQIGFGFAHFLGISAGQKKRILWLSMIGLFIGHLAYFKWTDVHAPPGLSYLTLQLVGLMIWVYFKKSPEPVSWLKFCFSALFFPSLISGPVLRHEKIAAQLKTPQPRVAAAEPMISSAFVMICSGLLKKTVGDQLGLFLSEDSSPDIAQGWYAFVSILAFYLQCYADFAGYSDIARGLARAFGIEIPANFNLPFYAANITEHWKRWHMSLNEWFREYVFTWLFASNYSKIHRHFRGVSISVYLGGSILLTCLLIGAWHGVSFKFAVWSFINGLLIVLHQGWLVKIRIQGRAFHRFCVVTTFLSTAYLNALFLDMDIRSVARLLASSLNPTHYTALFNVSSGQQLAMIPYTGFLLGVGLFGVHRLDAYLIERDFKLPNRTAFFIFTTLCLAYGFAGGALRQAFLYSRF